MIPSRKHAGFTLLELMLAMAIAVILSMTLYRTFSTAIQARRTAQSVAQTTRGASVALDLICHDLESVLPPPPSDTTTSITGTGTTSGSISGTATGGSSNGPITMASAFEGAHQGNGDDLSFSTIETEESADPNDPLAEGTRYVEFFVQQGTPPMLVRRVTRNVLATMQKPGVDEPLCRGVHTFNVQYFDGTNWQTDWDSTQLGDVLPFAVRITLDVDDPQATQSNGLPVVRELTRTIPLACAKTPPDTTTTQ